jgi:hypothetical protein
LLFFSKLDVFCCRSFSVWTLERTVVKDIFAWFHWKKWKKNFLKDRKFAYKFLCGKIPCILPKYFSNKFELISDKIQAQHTILITKQMIAHANWLILAHAHTTTFDHR